MRLVVRSVFGIATLQDAGRAGYRSFGVPVSGAFDSESFQLANALLGNALDAPVVEFALGTLELVAETGGCVAVVGAGAASIGSEERGTNTVVALAANESLTVSPPTSGLRTYIAVPGGVSTPQVLGSASGRAIDVGAEIASSEDRTVEERRLAKPPSSLAERPLRFVPNNEDPSWCVAEYKVGRNIDRVGLRFEGPKPMLDARSGRSEPSVFGAVQLTEDRTVIVHGPDGPTIGGYKKLGGVIRADLDRLGQLALGDSARFESVGLDEAHAVWQVERVRREEALRLISLVTD